jgi:CBS domain-containing membrane protein
MSDTPEKEKITDEDLREALRDMKGYVDISIEDLRAIYSVALRHARQRLAEQVPVSKVMTRAVVTVAPDADLQEVTRLLGENNVSGLPVVDAAGRVVGLISEADVLSMTGVKRGHTFKDVVRHVLGEAEPTQQKGSTVADFMTSPAITVRPDTDVREAARMVDEKRIKRLPVVDEQGRLVGIVSRADMLKVVRTR